MGINGRDTNVNFTEPPAANGSGSSGGSGGGNGGYGGSGGSGPSSQPDGWADAPRNLKAEVMASNFNTTATPGGSEAWDRAASHIPKATELVQVFEQKLADETRILWSDYGKKLDAPKSIGDSTVTYSSGAIHIYERHAEDFQNRGIMETNIMRTIREVATTGTLIESGAKANGTYEVREWNGNKWRLAIGTNGFIVSAYPIKKI